MRPSPLGFDVLGTDVFDTVRRLVSEIFTNDMPRLLVGGNLRPVIMIFLLAHTTISFVIWVWIT
jgi:hypothetical protein